MSLLLALHRRSHQRCSRKKGDLRNFAKFTGKHLYQCLFFNKVAAETLLKRDPGTGVFLCEFCKIKKIFLTEQLRVTASDYIKLW